MGRPRTACHTCAAIKTVCSREVPCARCRRLSLPCSLAAITAWALPEAAAEVLTRPNARTRAGRSSQGCTNCRRRRKKCDERLPACGDCRRLGLKCHSRTPLAIVPPPNVAADLLDIEAAVPSPTYSAPFDWLAVIVEERRAESAKVANLAHSSALDVLPEARASDDEPPAELGNLPSNALSNLAGIEPARLATWTLGERHLLNHFLQSVARALVVVDDEANPFLRLVVPMVLENELVKHALAALAACHLAQVYPDFERNLLAHRHRTLEGLKVEMEAAKPSVAGLTATLLLCLCEICEGSSRKWLLYLHGAHALLCNLASSDDPAVAFLVELYKYLTCVASISPISFNLHPRAATISASRAAQSVQPIHPLFGVALPLYQCLQRINQLAFPRHSLTATAFRDEARAIDLALQSWDPPAEAHSVDSIELRAAAFAVQWSAILRLRQVAPIVHPTTEPSDHLQGVADHILSAVSLIRPGSKAEAHLLFPLFMAGAASTSKASRLTVEYRINVIKTTVGFGHIATAQRLLNDLWRSTNNGASVPWEHLAELQPGLLLF